MCVAVGMALVVNTTRCLVGLDAPCAFSSHAPGPMCWCVHMNVELVMHVYNTSRLVVLGTDQSQLSCPFHCENLELKRETKIQACTTLSKTASLLPAAVLMPAPYIRSRGVRGL